MSKKLVRIFLVCGILLTGCYNDDLLKKDIADLQARVAKLETLCNQLNTNIGSLQSIVSALENKDYITSINPIREGDVIIGYTLIFTKSGEVKIYHGEKGDKGDKGEKGDHGQKGDKGDSGAAGKNGETPIIGVKLDADGVYYWTLNGEWLLDSSGNKVRATGADGKNGKDGTNGKDGVNGTNGTNGKDGKDGTNGTNGVTPQLKIEEGYWYVSYDNGSTWNKLGAAQSDQGDSMFSAVTFDSNFVYVSLAEGGTVLTIPRFVPITLTLNTDVSESPISGGETVTIKYTIVGATNQTVISASSDGIYTVKVIHTDEATGSIQVTCPSPYVDGFINVMVDNGYGYMVLKVINFTERKITLTQGPEYRIGATGANVVIPFVTNDNYKAKPADEDAGWISVVETKTEYNAQATIHIDANTQAHSRIGRVILSPVNGDGSSTETLYFVQASDAIPNYNDVVFYTTSFPGGLLVNPNCFNENILFHCSSGLSGAILFDNPVTMIDGVNWSGAFQNAASLTSFTIPSSVTFIGAWTFYNCTNLASITIPNSVTSIGDFAFRGCTGLTSITIPDSVTSLSGFTDCSNLSSITIPNSVTNIGYYAFYGCTSLSSIIIPNSVTSIDWCAFQGCTGLTSITIPDSVLSLGGNILMGCSNLNFIKILPLTPPSGDNSVFFGSGTCPIYVPAGSVNAYKLAWTSYADRITAVMD